jgi:hypothetical protein
MQVVQVPFCDGTAFALRSDADKARVTAGLRDILGLDTERVLRGQAQRYNGRTHAACLRRPRDARFVASLRPKGSRYLVVFLRLDDHDCGGGGACVFIDTCVREGHAQPRMLLVRLHVLDPAVCDGTVLTGELVLVNNSRWAFLASDLLADRGQLTHGLGLHERADRLARVLSPASIAPNIATDPCFLRAKRYFPVTQLRSVLQDDAGGFRGGRNAVGGCDYAVNGVVFTPVRGTGMPDEEILFSWHEDDRVPRGQGQGQGQGQGRGQGQGQGQPPPPPPPPPALEQSVAPSPPPPPPLPSPPRVRTFHVRATTMPDVYELYDTAEAAAHGTAGAPIAGVPTMRHSSLLKLAVSVGGPLEFVFSDKFHKWVPGSA